MLTYILYSLYSINIYQNDFINDIKKTSIENVNKIVLINILSKKNYILSEKQLLDNDNEKDYKQCMSYYEKNTELIRFIIENKALNNIIYYDDRVVIEKNIEVYCKNIKYKNLKYNIYYNIDNIIGWINKNITNDNGNKKTYNYMFLSKIKIDSEFYNKYISNNKSKCFDDDAYISSNNIDKKFYNESILKIIMFIEILMSEILNFLMVYNNKDYFYMLLFNDVLGYINNNINIFINVDICISKIVYLNLLLYKYLSKIIEHINNKNNNN